MSNRNAANPLWNADLEPTDVAQRTWTATHYAALWVSMAVSVPAYMLAAGLMSEGMNWWEAVLTAMVGFWATLALNIPDFTRFARSQRDQMIGQALGLPLPMGLLALVAVVVTSATVVIYGEAIWDPVALTGKMGGISVVVALLALIVATITTNLAANVVSPAYDFSNLAPGKISFKMGGYITAAIGLVMFPWKILETTHGYIFTWLIGYGGLLGPVAGILLIDYFVIRKTELNHDALFDQHGEYGYRNGWNLRALLALIVGVLPNLPGFLKAAGFITDTAPIFDMLYTYAWFVGLAISAIVYYVLMLGQTSIAAIAAPATPTLH